MNGFLYSWLSSRNVESLSDTVSITDLDAPRRVLLEDGRDMLAYRAWINPSITRGLCKCEARVPTHVGEDIQRSLSRDRRLVLFCSGKRLSGGRPPLSYFEDPRTHSEHTTQIGRKRLEAMKWRTSFVLQSKRRISLRDKHSREICCRTKIIGSFFVLPTSWEGKAFRYVEHTHEGVL